MHNTCADWGPFACAVRLDRGRPRPRDFQVHRAGDEPVRWFRATSMLHGVLLFPLVAILEQYSQGEARERYRYFRSQQQIMLKIRRIRWRGSNIGNIVRVSHRPACESPTYSLYITAGGCTYCGPPMRVYLHREIMPNVLYARPEQKRKARKSLVVPKKRLQAIPMVRVPV